MLHLHLADEGRKRKQEDEAEKKGWGCWMLDQSKQSGWDSFRGQSHRVSISFHWVRCFSFSISILLLSHFFLLFIFFSLKLTFSFLFSYSSSVTIFFFLPKILKASSSMCCNYLCLTLVVFTFVLKWISYFLPFSFIHCFFFFHHDTLCFTWYNIGNLFSLPQLTYSLHTDHNLF